MILVLSSASAILTYMSFDGPMDKCLQPSINALFHWALKLMRRIRTLTAAFMQVASIFLRQAVLEPSISHRRSKCTRNSIITYRCCTGRDDASYNLKRDMPCFEIIMRPVNSVHDWLRVEDNDVAGERKSKRNSIKRCKVGRLNKLHQRKTARRLRLGKHIRSKKMMWLNPLHIHNH